MNRNWDKVGLGRFLMLIAMGASIGLFGGCSTISSALQSPAQSIEATCTAVGTAVQVLSIAEQSGKLNSATEKTVDGLIQVTEPICSAPSVPTLADAEKTLFVNAAAQLATLAANYQTTHKLTGVSQE